MCSKSVKQPIRSKISSDKSDAASTDPRHAARAAALQFLYQLESQRGENLEMLEDFLTEYTDNDKTRALAETWIQGTWRNLERIDPLIRSASQNWDMSRINPVDLSNLRLGVYQLLECGDISARVVINEAIELAKQFSTTEASGFVNGVLDSINNTLSTSD
jgi:N utilization substance protein B